MKRNGETVEYQVTLNIPDLREKINKTCANRPVSCVNGEKPSDFGSDKEPAYRCAERARTLTERLFCAFLLKKLPENTFYWTFILLYSCQNKKTQEGRGMKDIELRYVGGHVEVYTGAGAFLFSADTLREAMEELDAA